MAVNFDDVKRIKQRTKDIVFGYIRKSQQLLPDTTTYYNIPDLAYHLCLLFYWPKYIKCKFRQSECKPNQWLFDQNSIMSLTDDRTILTAIPSDNSCYIWVTLDIDPITKGIHCFRIRVMFIHFLHFCKQYTTYFIFDSDKRRIIDCISWNQLRSQRYIR